MTTVRATGKVVRTRGNTQPPYEPPWWALEHTDAVFVLERYERAIAASTPGVPSLLWAFYRITSRRLRPLLIRGAIRSFVTARCECQRSDEEQNRRATRLPDDVLLQECAESLAEKAWA